MLMGSIVDGDSVEQYWYFIDGTIVDVIVMTYDMS